MPAFAQRAEVALVALRRADVLDEIGPQRAHQRLAFVFVQAGQHPRLGQRAVAVGEGGERLRVAPQRAAQHRFEDHAAFGEPGTERLALARPEFAELVVVGGAERGLTVAHEVEHSHGARFSRAGRRRAVAAATACVTLVA
jgi:hypothetical protein